MVYSTDKMYHIGCSKEDIGSYVFLPGDPGRCEAIASYFDNGKYVASNREYVTYTGYLEGEKVSVTSTGIGGPSTAIAIEELCEIGAHTFIRIGSCGGMQIEVMGGDIVIATGSIRMDGTSKEYVPIEFPAVPNFEVLKSIVIAAESSKVRHHVGIVQSKDSFYGQHNPQTMPVGYELQQKWDAWTKAGALASEMESSTLFTVASTRRVRAGALFYVVANQRRNELKMENPKVFDPDLVIKVAVDAMKNIISADKNKANL